MEVGEKKAKPPSVITRKMPDRLGTLDTSQYGDGQVRSNEGRQGHCPWPQGTGDTGQFQVGAWMGSRHGRGTAMDVWAKSE